MTILLICIWAFNIALVVDNARSDYELMEMDIEMHCLSHVAQLYADDTTIVMEDVRREALRELRWGFYEQNHSVGCIKI